MRLIDADKLEPHEFYDGFVFVEAVYMNDIRKMPESIVRCKDCKYWFKDYVSEDDLKYYHYKKDFCIKNGEYKDIPMDADDFCSKGEKKGD